MPRVTYAPTQKVNIGVGKDDVNDFARKYNLEIEAVYDILNRHNARAVVFYSTSDYWSQTETGYKLSLPHNGNVVFAVYRADSANESTQVLTGVKQDATNVEIESVEKFDGFMLYGAMNHEKGIGYNTEDDIVYIISEIKEAAEAAETDAENFAVSDSEFTKLTGDDHETVYHSSKYYSEITGAIADRAEAAEDAIAQEFNQKGYSTYPNVAALRNASVVVWQLVKTMGYYSINDGGDAFYAIRTATLSDVDDGGSIIILDNENVAELITDGTVNVKQFGAKGNNDNNDTLAVQKAVDYCIQTGKSLYVPAGTYLLYPATTSPISFGLAYNGSDHDHITADGQGIIIYGDGESSVFKEADGQTEQGGKWTRMFYCYLGSGSNNLEIGDIVFRDICFDKNGRSNADPSSRYEWEQAHIVSFAGSGTKSIDSVVFDRCYFKDKVGGGVNFSTSYTLLKHGAIRDCIFDWYSHAGDPAWGERGDIEVDIHSDMFVVDGVNANFMQSEPTVESSVTNQRHVYISNSSINKVEMTAGKYDFLYITNLKAYGFLLVRGYQAFVSNSIFAVNDYFFSYHMNVSNCTILFPYKSDTNTITQMSLTVRQNSAYPVVFNFENCNFMIDSNDGTITPTKAGITSNVFGGASKEVNISNCYFDPRLAGSVDWYYCQGKLRVENCMLAGTSQAILGGAYSSYKSDITLVNCDFTNVTGNGVTLNANNTLWRFKAEGCYNATDWKVGVANPTNLSGDEYICHPRFYGNAIPTHGFWFKGDIIYNTAPTAGGNVGWICTASGNHGTWKSFGTIEA